jgi:hypothetical protein
MAAYLINHLRQPGVMQSEVLDYLEQVQATLDLSSANIRGDITR